MKVPWDTPLPKVTISLGVYTFDQGSNTDSSEIIRRADAALYLSKRRGRNRSTIWEPGFASKKPCAGELA